MIRDDRGQPTRVRFRGLPIFARLKRAGGVRRHQLYEIGWLRLEAIAIAWLLGVLLFVGRFTVLGSPPFVAVTTQLIGTLLLLWGPLALISIVVAATASSSMCSAIFAARDAKGVCRSCGFPITGLNPEPDDCTVCPECGAAWRLLASSATSDPDPA